MEENSVTSLRTQYTDPILHIYRQVEEYTHLIASIKAQIKLACQGIRELLQLPAEKPLPQRILTFDCKVKVVKSPLSSAILVSALEEN
ncbi:hypothetical protein G4B88_025034 [Cannabis sativa]|uniref:Uncharacterized protein n=1 Tax=Cannabis sativa TaxID=3483 RepID=A0A7J6DR46_CANSA|nr:hypothetical protein G4B88_025034 [Cannabis sativa]